MKKRLESEQTGLFEEVVLIKKKNMWNGKVRQKKGPEDQREKNVQG
jgi:hypothetical protein